MPPSQASQRTILIASLALLAVFSITTFSLKATTLTFIADHSLSDFTLNPNDLRGQRMLDDLPLYLYIAPTKLAIASGIVSTILSIAVLLFALFAWPDGKRTYPLPPTRILPPLLTLPALLAFLSITHALSAHFDPDYRDSRGGYGWGSTYFRGDDGAFDLETWACDLAAYPGVGDMYGTYASRCRVEAAARWLLVPGCLVAVGVAGVGFWACRGARGMVSEGLQKRRERREYFGAGWEETGG